MKDLNISVTRPELVLVIEALGELPAKRSHALLNKIGMQATKQMTVDTSEEVSANLQQD